MWSDCEKESSDMVRIKKTQINLQRKCSTAVMKQNSTHVTALTLHISKSLAFSS